MANTFPLTALSIHIPVQLTPQERTAIHDAAQTGECVLVRGMPFYITQRENVIHAEIACDVAKADEHVLCR